MWEILSERRDNCQNSDQFMKRENCATLSQYLMERKLSIYRKCKNESSKPRPDTDSIDFRDTFIFSTISYISRPHLQVKLVLGIYRRNNGYRFHLISSYCSALRLYNIGFILFLHTTKRCILNSQICYLFDSDSVFIYNIAYGYD